MMARSRYRVRLEDGLKLDLNLLVRQNLIRPGASWGSTIHWTRLYSGEEVVSGRIAADMTSDRRGALFITVGRVDQTIYLEALPRAYGGRQWYFICPRTGQRASVLWKPPGADYFASRQTWGRQVAYGSQFETPHDRALSKAQNIRYRLGGAKYVPLIEGISPPRPKGMHLKTYEQIMKRCNRYESITDQYLVRLLSRLRR
jgi:hypothetical protein